MACIILTVSIYFETLKKQLNQSYLERFVDLSKQQFSSLLKEYEDVEKLIHDTKHKALMVYQELQDKKYDSVEPLFQEWINDMTLLLHMPLCNNTVVDLILSSKIEQYKEIDFNMKLDTIKDISVDTSFLSSLLLLIVDMSCKSLLDMQDKEYDFKIFMSKEEISIYSKYRGKRNTDDIQLLEALITRYNNNLCIDEDGIHLLIFL